MMYIGSGACFITVAALAVAYSTLQPQCFQDLISTSPPAAQQTVVQGLSLLQQPTKTIQKVLPSALAQAGLADGLADVEPTVGHVQPHVVQPQKPTSVPATAKVQNQTALAHLVANQTAKVADGDDDDDDNNNNNNNDNNNNNN